MSYRVDSIPNIRTIKALRGDALRIDLGKEFPGLLTAWMKRDPNDLEYRSFEVQENRYLYLTEEKTSDWATGSELISKIEGKWYFDVEQDLEDGSDKKTIYRGTIFFYNDITGSVGQEAIAPPDNRYRTVDIVPYIKGEESLSKSAETQSEINIEVVNELKAIREDLKIDSAYNFKQGTNYVPQSGEVSFNATNFNQVDLIRINVLDNRLFNNFYFIEQLSEDDFLTFEAANGAERTVAYKVISEPVLVGDYYEIDVVVESSVGTMFHEEESLNILGLKVAIPALLEEDVEVVGVGEVGGWKDGDIATMGTPFTQFAKRLLQKLIPATYTAPTSSLAISVTGNREIGSTHDVSLTPAFNQNDGGAILSVVFKRDGVIIHTQSDLSVFSDLNRITQPGGNKYSVEIFYEQGPIKNDNFGNPSPAGQIQAGSTSSNASYNGLYYNWYGGDTDAPVIGVEIRSLTPTFNNSFTLNTGDVNTVFIIAVPSTKNLSSVIDQDALNVDLTASYILSGTITSVPDAQGNSVTYKVYVMEISTPYSSNHRHLVTIS